MAKRPAICRLRITRRARSGSPPSALGARRGLPAGRWARRFARSVRAARARLVRRPPAALGRFALEPPPVGALGGRLRSCRDPVSAALDGCGAISFVPGLSPSGARVRVALSHPSGGPGPSADRLAASGLPMCGSSACVRRLGPKTLAARSPPASGEATRRVTFHPYKERKGAGGIHDSGGRTPSFRGRSGVGGSREVGGRFAGGDQRRERRRPVVIGTASERRQ